MLEICQDYTEIRHSRIRGRICNMMSEMLDNPDKHGIYPTSKFMWEMETFVLAEIQPYKDALTEIVETRPIECDGNFQEMYACILHDKIAKQALNDKGAETSKPII